MCSFCFFFKQKTAYEMRISDWSSDVCSSDLYCLWTPLGRGTPDNPGLMLGLDRGGSCRGIAYRLPPGRIEEELSIVWAREMLTDGYRPVWVRVRTDRKSVV